MDDSKKARYIAPKNTFVITKKLASSAIATLLVLFGQLSSGLNEELLFDLLMVHFMGEEWHEDDEITKFGGIVEQLVIRY